MTNPQQIEFFKLQFTSYDHFMTEKTYFETTYFKLLSVRSSDRLGTDSPLYEKFQIKGKMTLLRTSSSQRKKFIISKAESNKTFFTFS